MILVKSPRNESSLYPSFITISFETSFMFTSGKGSTAFTLVNKISFYYTDTETRQREGPVFSIMVGDGWGILKVIFFFF